MLPVKNLRILNILKKVKTKAACCKGTEFEGRTVSLLEMNRHLMFDCQENRSCKTCNLDFETLEDFQNHIRFSCSDVSVVCNHCDK